jgi:hypothetical protein
VFRIASSDPEHIFAYYISMALNPTTLGAVAAAAFSAMFGASPADKLLVFFISFTFCVLLPFLYLVYLKVNGRVEAIDVPKRTQRTVPYLIAVCSYAGGLALLIWVAAPWQLVALLTAYLVNTLIILAINLYWKISAHAMGVGAVVAGFAVGVSPVFYWGLLLLPIVSWSRIKLDVHSRNQVIAGSILSVILTVAQFELVLRYYGS